MEYIKEYVGFIAIIMEAMGVFVILIGMFYAFLQFLFPSLGNPLRSFKILRQEIGKAILLGLEILVAADIIATVVTEPTMDSVLTLGVIVLIRTFLSVSLEVELDGKFPWQKQQTKF
jgi:uncharacterized membrane protein